jgi:hypothetical protein
MIKRVDLIIRNFEAVRSDSRDVRSHIHGNLLLSRRIMIAQAMSLKNSTKEPLLP